MPETIADTAITDTTLGRDATKIVWAATNDLLLDHSRRVLLWNSLKGRARGAQVDPEALYVAAMFHDLGLTENYRRRRAAGSMWTRPAPSALV